MTNAAGEIVILVLAHKLDSLQCLPTLLGGTYPIIAHIDAKMHIPDDVKESLSSIALLDHRLPIYWGGFNMSLATIALIDEAYRLYPNFSRLVLVSGDSLPCISVARIRDFFLEHPNTEFIQLTEIENDKSLRGVPIEEARIKHGGNTNPWRFQNFMFYDNDLHCSRSRDTVMSKFSVPESRVDFLRGTSYAAVKQVLSRLPERPALYEKFYFGSQWWSLSRLAVDLIVDDLHVPAHQDFFRFFQASDEHFIHTLVGSKRVTLERRGIAHFRPMTHVNPGFMTAQDLLHAAKHSNRVFVRKFTPEAAPEISEAIASGSYDRLLGS